MAITSLDTYIASAKQVLPMQKTATRTSIAAQPFSVFDLAGNPGAGTLNVGNTANGLVPTDATAGYPTINTFGGGATGYLSLVRYASTVASRITIYDRLFVAGAYAFNANTNLTSQPSFSSRIPGGTDYKGLQLWVEMVTAATGNQAVAVTYTNQDGTGSRATGAVGIGAAPTVGRCWQLPLQAGDSGIQRIDNVTGSVASAGTFNVMILRPLWEGRIVAAGGGGSDDLLRTGLPQLFADSALYMMITADSTSTGIPAVTVEIANG